MSVAVASKMTRENQRLRGIHVDARERRVSIVRVSDRARRDLSSALSRPREVSRIAATVAGQIVG